MREKWINLSCKWKVSLPILIVGILFSVLVYFLQVHLSMKLLEKTALENAEKISKQIMVLRSYYTTNVVKAAKTSGLEVTFDYGEKPSAIPLPATLVHELNSIFSQESDYRLRLYSRFPFPFREDGGAQDHFEEDALKFLEGAPQKKFWKIENYKGRPSLRYATADVMSAEACVNCHNSHPLTPKSDWELGNVRGVLEVILPIDKSINTFESNAQKSIVSIGICILLMVILVHLMIHYFINRPLDKIKEKSMEIANGNLMVSIDYKSKDEMGLLASAIMKLDRDLNSVIKQVVKSASELAVLGSSLSFESEMTVKGAKEQASQSDGVASATEEMTATIQEIAQSSAEASNLSQQTHTMVDENAKVVEETSSIVFKQGENSKKIGEVMSFINDIASKTDLLAVNAGIEAANAGKHGKGFGVVAEEVRKLAEKTASAAAKITTIVNDIQHSSEEAVIYMDKVTSSFLKAKSNVSMVDERITQIATAAEEQTAAADEISRNIHQICRIAKETETSSQEDIKVVQQVTGAAEELKKRVAIFKVEYSDAELIHLTKGDHRLWVQRLHNMLAGIERIDPAELASHKECRLGQWYYSRGMEACRSNHTFQSLDAPHQQIHNIGKKMAELYNSGEKERAEDLMAQLEETSKVVIRHLEELQKTLGGTK